jgi:Rieske 2Fe-2S family protein
MHTTLPARYYTDPAQFAAELDRFYFRMWVCVGRADQIANPGEYFLRDIGGESIIVTRDRDVCRHRGTRLATQAEGKFHDRIQCPYHAWTYDLQGSLVGAPHMSETALFCKEDYPLHRIDIAVWAGHVFVNLSKQHDPLATQLDDLPAKFRPWGMDELRLVRRIVYDVKTNWKLVILNYNECLHCPILHPLLNRLTNYLGADNEAPRPTYIGGSMGFRDGAETMSMDGKRRRDYLPGVVGADRQRVAYYVVYPNLLLSLHPDYMMTHTLWPRATDRTEIVCEWHFHPNEIAKPDFQPDDAIEFWDVTNREDWRSSASARELTHPDPTRIASSCLRRSIGDSWN